MAEILTASLDFRHYKGDTFPEQLFQIEEEIDNVVTNMDLTGAVINMQLRIKAGENVFLNLTSVADAGITITDATAGEFKINSQIINIDARKYLYDLQITLQNEEVFTYIKGFFEVINDITRPS